MKSALLTLPLLVAAATASEPVTPAEALPAATPQAAERTLALHEGMTYRDLFQQYEAMTGEVLLRSEGLEAWVTQARLPIHGPRAVSQDELPSVFQGLLRAGYLALIEAHAGPTTMKQVISLHGKSVDRHQADGAQLLIANARSIGVDELQEHATDYATAYRILLDTEEGAHRYLRGIMNPYGIFSVGQGMDDSTVIVTGFGSDLVSLIQLIGDGSAPTGE